MTNLFDGLVQEVLRLLPSLGSVVPSPEPRELGKERPHVVDIEGLVHLLDCLGLFSRFRVFYIQPCWLVWYSPYFLAPPDGMR
jgi:hypothetical protein